MKSLFSKCDDRGKKGGNVGVIGQGVLAHRTAGGAKGSHGARRSRGRNGE